MHKKGVLKNLPAGGGCLAGINLPKESGFYSEKMEVSFERADLRELPGPLHTHNKMDELVIVLRGRFVVEMDGEQLEINQGEYVFKNAGSPGRAIAADFETEILIVKSPSVAGDVSIIG